MCMGRRSLHCKGKATETIVFPAGADTQPMAGPAVVVRGADPAGAS